ncbi:Transient Receptor Potential Cation Channel Subfamily A Member 1 [Manis pentadactyla]|nr:Transient Receptor Potential Cation Channel Subfamily A Member 1 [Manis pentadactyla]
MAAVTEACSDISFSCSSRSTFLTTLLWNILLDARNGILYIIWTCRFLLVIGAAVEVPAIN